jgi:hypothetical protein
VAYATYEFVPNKGLLSGCDWANMQLSVWKRAMLFLLRLKGGDKALPHDGEPEAFTNLEGARLAAIEALRELAAYAICDGRLFDYTGIDIFDLDGKLVSQVLTSEAVPQLK